MNEGCSVKVKVTIHKDESFFGPGIVMLLKLIDQTGSVKLACHEMGLSYSKAWTIINRAENQFGYALIARSQGGTKGGGASLTEKGRLAIDKYDRLEESVRTYARKTFEDIFLTDSAGE